MAGVVDTSFFIRDILSLHSINPIVLPVVSAIVKLLKKQVITVAVIVAGIHELIIRHRRWRLAYIPARVLICMKILRIGSYMN